MSKPRIVFDVETNGLLPELTKVNSLVLRDRERGVTYSCCDDPDYISPNGYPVLTIEQGLDYLQCRIRDDGAVIVGHNIIGFDIPALQKVYPWFTVPDEQVLDTIVYARLVFPDLKDRDFKTRKKTGIPGKLIGTYKLAAFGYRLGEYKGDYEGPWDTWNPAMQEYCEQDVEVTDRLLDRLDREEYPELSIWLEHAVAWLCWRMEQMGFPFDVEGAAKLYAELSAEREELRQELTGLFPSWWAPGKLKTPKKTMNFKAAPAKRKPAYRPDLVEGCAYTEVKLTEFNPTSRDHIANRLQTLKGWKPKEFTDGGKPKIDETVLGKLPYPEAKKLARYFLLDKRIGQLAEGKQAWLKLEKNGLIHARYNTNGAVTGRATHFHPNIAQVPKVGKAYGEQCRSLFGSASGWVLLGCDMSGLELRCLGHFMARYDDGAYITEVLEGDVHTANQKAAGLPTRDNAKTFIYAFLYGAGDAKIGSIVKKGPKAGKKLKNDFLAQTPALKRLKEQVQKAAKRGYLKGLDGRKLHIRSDHSALNTLLQSAGALLCKVWLVLLWEELHARGYKHGWDGDFVYNAWCHDEVQMCVKPEIADEVGQIAVEMCAKAGEFFDFRCPLTGEYKIGNNWAETH